MNFEPERAYWSRVAERFQQLALQARRQSLAGGRSSLEEESFWRALDSFVDEAHQLRADLLAKRESLRGHSLATAALGLPPRPPALVTPPRPSRLNGGPFPVQGGGV